jgi:serine O-acetyltransferase
VAVLARRRLIVRYSIDIGKGAQIGEGLRLPHPIGVVIGDGVVILSRVTIYQHVTLGVGRGGYPKVGSDVTIYPGSVIVGELGVGEHAVIGANCFVEAPVPPGMKLRGGSRWP